ncbi:MAG: hypothetical protein K6E84_01615 [Lachnospiraceae bacterium]|nr:hypothetical protein [Lachnospiraceae bacterium]
MDKKHQGEYGYLSYKKKIETLKTILYFAVPLALFAAGIITTGTKKNLLTLVAVLGILPASKNAVLAIMYLKSKSLLPEEYEKISEGVKACQKKIGEETAGALALYDLVFTTQSVTYEVPAILLYGGSVFGFVRCGGKSKGKKDSQELVQDLQKHLTTTLQKDRINASVKMYDSAEAFLQRISEIKHLENADEAFNTAAAKVLFQISL